MDSFLKGILVVTGGFIAVYAIRSYGYQKEVKGYNDGLMAAIDAYENKTE